jgi:hypothetical protein
LYSTPSPLSDNEAAADDSTEPNPTPQSVLPQRTTFDQAGKSLMDEQDNQRMEAMGDFDANPDVRVCKTSAQTAVVLVESAATHTMKDAIDDCPAHFALSLSSAPTGRFLVHTRLDHCTIVYRNPCSMLDILVDTHTY